MKADMAPLGLLGSFFARFARLALTGALAALFELLDDCCAILKPGGGVGSRQPRTYQQKTEKRKVDYRERTGAVRARGHMG